MKKFNVESDDKCPKCGVKQWWHNSYYLSRNGKSEIITSHCDNCKTVFKRELPLVPLTKNCKLVNEKKQLSKWQSFVAAGEGKSLKELSKLFKESKEVIV